MDWLDEIERVNNSGKDACSGCHTVGKLIAAVRLMQDTLVTPNREDGWSALPNLVDSTARYLWDDDRTEYGCGLASELRAFRTRLTLALARLRSGEVE